MGHEAGPSSLASAPSYAGAWSTLRPPLEATLVAHVQHTLGFTQMTPVQSNVIPLFLNHKDVIVEAVTGSGKTLAYILPALQMLSKRTDRLKRNQVGALILCPTHELAEQVHGVLEGFLDHQLAWDAAERDEGQQGDASTPDGGPRIRVSGALLAVGGSTSSPADDYRRFKEQGSDVIVGTPGRVYELLERTSVDCKELEVLILDEADRLLDMGFAATITSILRLLPKQRRTGLFSATMTDAMGELVRVGLRNPVRVVVKVETKITQANGTASTNTTTNDKRMPATLDNRFLVTRPEHKLLQLVRILRAEAGRAEGDGEAPMRKAIVFFATCAEVNHFYKSLSNLPQLQGLRLYSLHGKQTPSRRRATFDAFVSANPLGTATPEETSSILLCTDVAARGLDLPNVDLVIQYDPPTDPKVFSHRCGRTARAGRSGRAVVLLHPGREEDYVDFLKVRKNPVKPYGYVSAAGTALDGIEPEQVEEDAVALHQAIRNALRQDRALFDLSMQAFVSFVQCYRKHEVSLVFRERDLDYGALAFAFGLLRLPRMPEVDRWKKQHMDPSKEISDGPDQLFIEQRVDRTELAFADKVRERQRQEGLQAKAALSEGQVAGEGHDAGDDVDAKGLASKGRRSKPVEAAWSHQKDRKQRRTERREKRQRKRAYLARQDADDAAMTEASKDASETKENGSNAIMPSHGKEDDEDGDDQDDWAEEEREAKKARRGQRGKADLDMGSFDGL